MATTEQIAVPDLGGADDVDVIEVLVNVGDTIRKEDPLLTLESDKASMEVPSPIDGEVVSIDVSVGDKVSAGTVILSLKTSNATGDESMTSTEAVTPTQSQDSEASVIDIVVPDLGGAESVDVIEVHVQASSTLSADDPVLTLESDKASMEMPAPFSGEIIELTVSVGDKISTGDVVGRMTVANGSVAKVTPPASAAKPAPREAAAAPSPAQAVQQEPVVDVSQAGLYIGPAVRRLAREFGVDLSRIKGTGNKGRITKEDLQSYVKTELQQAQQGGGMGFNFPDLPVVDFKKFGHIEEEPLSKINKISGAFLHRNWVSIPHVTQFEDIDIEEMEALRQRHKQEAADKGIKLTPIVFVMKALQATLKAFPRFNASLSKDGQSLIMKQYYNIGVAVDTPNGLVVPVIREVEQKGAMELAAELGAISKKAREKGLTPADMQGGCISISSLGGIGGTAFTPIINAPEVAIVGLSRSYRKPVYNPSTNSFEPRLTLPVSLSYDHRVIDGAEAARFIVHLASRLADMDNLIL